MTDNQNLQNNSNNIENSVNHEKVSRIFSGRPHSPSALTGGNILAPKTEIINTILGQHLTQVSFNHTFKQLQEEIGCNKEEQHSSLRLYEEKYNKFRVQLVTALKAGEEKLFFELRDSLFEDLNYYKNDFSKDKEVEIKLKVYFALYYQLPFTANKSRSYKDALEKTKRRMTELQRYFGQHCGIIMPNKDFKVFMKIPYMIEKNPEENSELHEFISEEFCNQVFDECSKEVDKILFFIKEVIRNRSFLTKIYEFYITRNQNPESHIHESAYLNIKKNLSKVESENAKLETDITDSEDLQKRLNVKYESMKNKFIEYIAKVDEDNNIKNKMNRLKEIGPEESSEVKLSPTDMNYTDQLTVNDVWLDKQTNIQKLANDYMELIKQKKKGIPVEDGHIKILSDKLKRIRKEVSQACLIDRDVMDNPDYLREVLTDK